MSKFANKFASYSLDSSLFVNITAKRDEGQFWDLGTRVDQERLEHMQQEYQTELLIGSAPCMSFRTLLCTPARMERNGRLRKCKTKRDGIHKHASKPMRDS